MPLVSAVALAFWLTLLPCLLHLIFYRASGAVDLVARDIQLVTVAGLTTLFIVLSAFTSPGDLFMTGVLLGSLIGVAYYAFVWWWSRWHFAHHDFAEASEPWREAGERISGIEQRRLGAAYLAVGLGTFLIAIILPQMWLPAERVVLQDGSSITAYVLSDTGDWSSLLLEENRNIIRVRSDEVKSRSICYAASSDFDSSPTLVQHIFRTSERTPECP